jgi:hypothetical protein
MGNTILILLLVTFICKAVVPIFLTRAFLRTNLVKKDMIFQKATKKRTLNFLAKFVAAIDKNTARSSDCGSGAEQVGLDPGNGRNTNAQATDSSKQKSYHRKNFMGLNEEELPDCQ